MKLRPATVVAPDPGSYIGAKTKDDLILSVIVQVSCYHDLGGTAVQLPPATVVLPYPKSSIAKVNNDFVLTVTVQVACHHALGGTAVQLRPVAVVLPYPKPASPKTKDDLILSVTVQVSRQ